MTCPEAVGLKSGELQFEHEIFSDLQNYENKEVKRFRDSDPSTLAKFDDKFNAKIFPATSGVIQS